MFTPKDVKRVILEDDDTWDDRKWEEEIDKYLRANVKEIFDCGNLRFSITNRLLPKTIEHILKMKYESVGWTLKITHGSTSAVNFVEFYFQE